MSTIKMGRKIIVCCGLKGSGKTYWRSVITRRLSRRNPIVITLDGIRHKYWGLKSLTDTEHVYKNKLALLEAQKEFIINKVNLVILEMVMLTKEQHQRPFIEMIQETEEFLTKINREERAKFINKPLDKTGLRESKIKVRSIWFHCDFETTKKRLLERQKHNPDDKDIHDIDSFSHLQSRFDLPSHNLFSKIENNRRSYITIDTSDDSGRAEQKRLKRILEYISQ